MIDVISGVCLVVLSWLCFRLVFVFCLLIACCVVKFCDLVRIGCDFGLVFDDCFAAAICWFLRFGLALLGFRVLMIAFWVVGTLVEFGFGLIWGG